jgi:DNA-binding response OmpR family regulator
MVFTTSPLHTVLNHALAGAGIVGAGFDVSEDSLIVKTGQGASIRYPLPFRLGRVLDDLRRGDGQTDAKTISLGARWVLIPALAALRCSETGEEVRLTEKERDILVLLDKHRGQGVERKTLLDTIWGYAEGVETHTLETHIHRLRRKIEADPSAPVILCTEGSLYRLV